MEKIKQNPPSQADKAAQKRPKSSPQKCGDDGEPFTEKDFMAALRKVARKMDEERPKTP